MAKKDFDRYYEEVENTYLEMLENLRDMEREMADGLVDPDMFEQMKEMIIPLKNNYETLGYVKFLLNKPVKKEKEKRYILQNKKLLAHSKTKEQVLKENRQVLDNLKELSL